MFLQLNPASGHLDSSDPFEDPPEHACLIQGASPEGKAICEGGEQMDTEELEDIIREKEAHSRAVTLEIIGDIPDADVKPPQNVLFVCKLNPFTEDEDLHTIFSRFGNIGRAEIIRDFNTGDSLCYAFIEFEDEEACIQAYKKMDNALIDDRRIKVDFCQSVSKLWNQFRRKGSKQGQGCFKCGSIDHIANDCRGTCTFNQQRNFELKDNNRQRGGQNNAKYELVFQKNEVSRRVSESTKDEENSRDTRSSRDSRGGSYKRKRSFERDRSHGRREKR